MQSFQFAIRPSIRSHNTLKRDDVIKSIANLVDPQHKVNLGAPDKVILLEIYQVRFKSASPLKAWILTCSMQTVCGISVVPGDWDTLKRYNLTELYKQAGSLKAESAKQKGEGDVGEAEKKTGD